MSNVKIFRKRPDYLKAMQFVAGPDGNITDVINWAKVRRWYIDLDDPERTVLYFPNCQIGKAKNGDWIVEDEDGNHYPVYHDHLESNYEEVKEVTV
ncbi:MAG: hypothetical protein AAGU15_08885 [Anaerolineaceae bacterium]